MTQRQLPPELLSIIVELLTFADKLNFSLTCKNFRDAALPALLYRVRIPSLLNEEELVNIPVAVKRATRELRISKSKTPILSGSYRIYKHWASLFPSTTSLSAEIYDSNHQDHVLDVLRDICTSAKGLLLRDVFLELESRSSSHTPSDIHAADYPTFPALKSFGAMWNVDCMKEPTTSYIRSLLSESTHTLQTLSLFIESEEQIEAQDVTPIIDAFSNVSDLTLSGLSFLLLADDLDDIFQHLSKLTKLRSVCLALDFGDDTFEEVPNILERSRELALSCRELELCLWHHHQGFWVHPERFECCVHIHRRGDEMIVHASKDDWMTEELEEILSEASALVSYGEECWP
ncbi:hypothetical protein ONZ45_g9029 [Pleurotus djamor]|nr:hypothetical protein ONZ45_g9029 [Pleurotus djamor]